MKKIIMILCVLFASTTVWAGKSYKLKECYHPQDDHDCDGYAVEGATGYWLGVDKYDLHCPSPFVDEEGDCNDNNANIHPRNRETGGYYGCDDDCDGQTDEPDFVPYESWQSTYHSTSYLRYTFQLNYIWHQIAHIWGHLWYRTVSYRLKNSSAPIYGSFTKLPAVDPDEAEDPITIYVPVSHRTTVYKTKIEFYFGSQWAEFPPHSEYHYATTSHASNVVSRTRTTILQRGFNEFNLSKLGLVGYRGAWSTDGRRYGASTNELWCSEFYATLTGDLLDDTANSNTVSDLIDDFDDNDNYYGANRIDDLGTRADYMPQGPSDTNDKVHSTMFLALDTSETPAKVWTLEGNSGNKVRIRTYEVDSGFLKGLGHISTSQLD